MANPNTDIRKYYNKKKTKTGNVVISTISDSFYLCTSVECSKTGVHILFRRGYGFVQASHIL